MAGFFTLGFDGLSRNSAYEFVFRRKMKCWSDKPKEDIQDMDLISESLMMKERLEEIIKQAKELTQQKQ